MKNENDNEKLLSMLALVQNAHLSEKEKKESENNVQKNDRSEYSDSSPDKPEYVDKFNILDALNQDHNYREYYDSEEEQVNISELNDELYTFGKDKRGDGKNERLSSLKQEIDSNKFEELEASKIETHNNSYTNTKSINLSMEVYKTVSKFKQLIVEKILLINTFSDNLAVDIQSNPDTYSIYEKSINSIYRIKENINEIFEETEKELEIISKNIEGVHNSNNYFQNNSQRNTFKDFKSSILEIANYNKTFANSHSNFSQFSQTSQINPNTNNSSYNFTSPEKQLNLNKTKILIEKITKHYKDKIKGKNEEIKKLKDDLKYYEKLIVSSKNLIDEVYSKNILLKQKLVKYKFIFDNNNKLNK